MEKQTLIPLIPLWEFAQTIDVSPSLISKLIKSGYLKEETHYRRAGRFILITGAGQFKIVTRNAKAGRKRAPKPVRAGGAK